MSYSDVNRWGSYSFGKPVEVGEEYPVDIVDISRRGDGVAKIQGLVVFVPNTSPGDHVKIRISRVGRNFATAEVV